MTTTGFYEKEVRFRSWMHYPPFAAWPTSGAQRQTRGSAALDRTLGKWFEATRHAGVRVLGPAAAPIVRLKRDYRYHFLLKSASREKLNASLRKMLGFADAEKIPRTNVIVDVDALSLL